MENEVITHDLVWLDEAFAKDAIDELEAACCLAGVSQNDVQVDDVPPNNLHYSDIRDPVVSKIFEIITSWSEVNWPSKVSRKSLPWYIGQALARNMPYVKLDLLLPKCKKILELRRECIEKYPALAENLGLARIDKSPKANQQEGQTLSSKADKAGAGDVDDEVSWRPKAREIYKELRPGCENLSKVQMAVKVEKEMQRRRDNGEKEMTKRGGKKIPDAETIRRFVINKL